ncbi:MAG: glycosyl hydrolase family 18 protein, partial [Chloroflexota bacterium]
GVLENQGSTPPDKTKPFLPNGSYKLTSRNIKVTLFAQCERINKTQTESSLDIENYNYEQGDIANVDGELKINQKCKIIQTTYVGDGNYDNLLKSINQDGKQPFRYVDYLYVAFADLDNSNPDSPKIFYKPDYEPKVRKIIEEAKKENPTLTIFAQFNWASHLDPLVEDSKKAKARIEAFAKSMPPFFKKYGFSGIDFDWEGVNLTTDQASYLFTQIKDCIGNGAYLSISADTTKSLNANAVNHYVDTVNVQSYNRLNLIDDFINIGIEKGKIHVGICSENDDPNGFYPPNGDISKYTKCVTDKGLPGLYAWRVDNDDTDHGRKVPRYTITKAMWKYSRGVVPPL